MKYIQTHTQIYTICIHTMGFSGGLVIKNTSVNARDMSFIHGLGRFPGEGMGGNLLQFSCLGIPQKEEPAGYSPWGRKRAGHDLATKAQQMSIIPL